MKRIALLLSTFLLITNLSKSQTSANSVTGNYIGQSVVDRSVMAFDVKENKSYVLKIYDSYQKLQKKVKGTWTLDGDKLVLTDKSGNTTILQKNNNIWYIAGKNNGSCLAKFYQNKDPKEFWSELMHNGC